MSKLLAILLFFSLAACRPFKPLGLPAVKSTSLISKLPEQRITIRTIRSGNYDDPNIWDLRVVPESWDVADICDSVSVRDRRVLKGLKSTRGGKIHCEPGGSLSISPGN
jgi:hypothetical protein